MGMPLILILILVCTLSACGSEGNANFVLFLNFDFFEYKSFLFVWSAL